MVGHAFGAVESDSGVLMQNQGGTEFANLHREFKRGADASRDSVQRMAQMQVTARKMESEYRALLEQVVRDPNTGTPYAPNMTAIIREQFDLLQGELFAEKDANQNLVNQANAAVARCNEVMVNETRDTVVPARTLSDNARNTHKDCRTTEETQITDRDVQCVEPSYGSYDGDPNFAGGTNVCGADQDFYNNGAKQAWTVFGGKYNEAGDNLAASPDLLATIVQAGACVAYREHGKLCDRNQFNFEEKFCAYSTDLRATCRAHTDCYTLQTTNRGVTVVDVTELERSQKMVWTALQKILCYMGHMQGLEQNGVNPTSADIQNCVDEVPTTTDLDIDKPAAEEKKVCDTSSVEFQPGDQQWRQDEYHKVPYSDAKLHQTAPYPLGDWQRGMETVTACR
jgi:hypothetical protein